jgi:hypothetical protein
MSKSWKQNSHNDNLRRKKQEKLNKKCHRTPLFSPIKPDPWEDWTDTQPIDDTLTDRNEFENHRR